MASLWNICREIADCTRSCVDATTGEFTGDEIDIERLNALEMDKETKIENILLWMKNLKAMADAQDAEAQALSKMAKSNKNKYAQLERILIENVPLERFETARCKMTWSNRNIVQIDDEAAIPKKYFRKKITIEPNKVDIKKILESGKKVKGCSLVSNIKPQIK